MPLEPLGVRVEGIPELLGKLGSLRTTSLQKALGYALSAAGVPIFGAISTRAELHDRSDSETSTGGADFGGHLADDLASTIEIDTQGRGGRISIGFDKMAAKAIWLEYGHKMISHKPDKRELKGPRTPDGVVIPGGVDEPGPIMRLGLDEAADQAADKFFETFIAVIQSEWELGGGTVG